MPAHDVQPDELDIARTVDWLEAETVIEVRRAPHAWAGLRTFAPDECPVVVFDPIWSGFFWLIGQGGYGIMMALSLARAARGLIVGQGAARRARRRRGDGGSTCAGPRGDPRATRHALERRGVRGP